MSNFIKFCKNSRQYFLVNSTRTFKKYGTNFKKTLFKLQANSRKICKTYNET